MERKHIGFFYTFFQKHKAITKKILQWILIAFAATVLAVCSYYISGCLDRSNSVHNYLSLKPDDMETLHSISDDYSLLNQLSAFQHFEELCLGNSNCLSQTFGLYCYKNGIECEATNDQFVIKNRGNDVVVSNIDVSYMNIGNDCIYYRSNNDRYIYSYSLETSEITVVINEQVRQTLLDNDKLYYIRMSDKVLCVYHITEDTVSDVLEDNTGIRSFALLGNAILYLDNENNLVLKDLSSENISVIQKDVDQFIYNGSIIIQKNGKIYRMSLGKSKAHVISSEESVLVGCSYNSIFFTDPSSTILYRYDLDRNLRDNCEDISDGLLSCYETRDGEVKFRFIE